MENLILPEISNWQEDEHGLKFHKLPNTEKCLKLVEKWVKNYPKYYYLIIKGELFIYLKEKWDGK